MRSVLWFFVITLSLIETVKNTGLMPIFSWTKIDYAWSNNGLDNLSEYSVHIKNGNNVRSIGNDGNMNKKNGKNVCVVPTFTDYNYLDHIPVGANVWKNKLFVTIPRQKLGISSTLNFVSLNSKNIHNEPLIPYPNSMLNLICELVGYENTERFVSVYRTAIDACDRLWFVDTGIIDADGNKTKVKPHELVIIDLNTDEIVSRHIFSENVINAATILTQLAIDTTADTCKDAYAYFPDMSGNGLIVFSLKNNKYWRFSDSYFYSKPFTRQGFQPGDGIVSVELSAIKPDGYRDVYFHSLVSTRMYRVSSIILRNEYLANGSYNGDDFEDIGDKGFGLQSASADIHKPTGIMFLSLLLQNAVGCWNINENLESLSVIYIHDKDMIYPSDIKISGDNLYVLTNLHYDQIIFRVWSNSVEAAVRGTKCQKVPGRR